MKHFKMLLLPGMVLGVTVALNAADVKSSTAPAPEAKAAGADVVAAMNQPKGTPVAEAFKFLPDTVATIGGKAVTKAELLKSLSTQLPGGMIPANFPAQMLPQMAPQLVEQYVQQLVMEQAVKDAKIVVSLNDAAAKLKAEVAKMPAEQRQMLEQMLKQQGKTIDDVIKEQAANANFQKGIAFEKLFEKSGLKPAAVTDAEAENFYKANPQQFKEPGDPADSIRASHILIKVDSGADDKAWAKAKAEIEKIAADIKKGADFGKIAAEKSACPSGKSANGSLGAFGKGQMVPEFEKAAYALKVGEVSAPVKTQFGYHLIRRDAPQAERQMAFAEVKDQLKAMLTQQKTGEAVRKFVDGLMKKANVKILVKAPAAPAAPAAPKAPAKAK